jgi:hypothetical protein
MRTDWGYRYLAAPMGGGAIVAGANSARLHSGSMVVEHFQQVRREQKG